LDKAPMSNAYCIRVIFSCWDLSRLPWKNKNGVTSR